MNNEFSNIPEAFFWYAAKQPEKVLYSQFISSAIDPSRSTTKLHNISLKQAAARVKSISSRLKRAGLKKGHKVAILSNTRPEWLETDIAILCLGAVVVSVYPSLPENELAYILWDSEAKFVVAENQEQVNKLEKINNKPILMPGCLDNPTSQQIVELEAVICFEEVNTSLPLINFKDCITTEVEDLNTEDYPNSKDIASIVYTSGTTGAPKGVLQSHANHLANVRQAKSGGLYRPESSIYMMLPLAHSFAKLMGYIGFLAGVQLQFPSVSDKKSSKINQRLAISELSNSSCSVYPLVPRILEKLKDGIEIKASKNNLSARLLNLTLLAAKNNNVGFLRLVTTPIRKALKRKLFGLNFEYVVSGGAKLPIDVNQFFAGLGIEVLEGYGLTETCVATNCNRPGHNRIGTVGPVLSNDIQLKIAEDGELLFSGPNIALGYHRKPTATASSWDSEGWFHTGDIGELDQEKCLKITGRKKEVIVTAGGKKIVPEKTEALLKANRLISQAVLIGEGRPYCIALVTLSLEAVPDLNTVKADVLQNLESYLDKLNSELASFETVKRLIVHTEEFSVDNGFLTPTLKVKRVKVAEAFAEQINQAYHATEKILYL